MINLLNPQGPIGAAEKSILIDSMAIMLPTMVAIFGFVWWFRASNRKARYLPDFEYSGRIELIVWAIPALVVMLLTCGRWRFAASARWWRERHCERSEAIQKATRKTGLLRRIRLRPKAGFGGQESSSQ
jgi:heme/copper-type cytochrome/quinol oxidase subunit 2